MATYRNWPIEYNELVIRRTIGHSSFSTLNQAKFNGTEAAVRTIHYDSTKNGSKNTTAFRTEPELNCCQ